MSTFNKDLFAKLLLIAKGNDRSINQYGLHCNISPAHISRLLRKKLESPPSPETIKKLADKACNNITYEEFMEAAGHISKGHQESLELIDGCKQNERIDKALELLEKFEKLPYDKQRAIEILIGMSEQAATRLPEAK